MVSTVVAADESIDIVADDCQRYRYDLTASNVSTEEWTEIMTLVGPVHTLREHWTSQLALCVATDDAYLPCGDRTPAAPNFWYNADVNIERGRDLIGRIRALRTSLDPIKAYFLFRYEFWLEVGTRKLAFLRRREPRLLTGSILGFEIQDECRREAAQAVANAGDGRSLSPLKDWHNCVNRVMHGAPTQSSGYPADEWQAFLEREQVIEHISRVADCRQES